MDNIKEVLTAEEFLKSLPKDHSWDLKKMTTNAMIEFAKLHVEVCKKELIKERSVSIFGNTWIDIKAILNYSLDKIK